MKVYSYIFIKNNIFKFLTYCIVVIIVYLKYYGFVLYLKQFYIFFICLKTPFFYEKKIYLFISKFICQTLTRKKRLGGRKRLRGGREGKQ